MSKRKWEIVLYIALVVSVLAGLIAMYPAFTSDADAAHENSLTYVWFNVGLVCFGISVFAYSKSKHAPVMQNRGRGVVYVFWFLLILGTTSAVSGVVLELLR